MRHRPIILLLGLATALAACNQKARSESSEAANAIAADVNATSAKAVSDTGNALDAQGNAVENTTNSADGNAPGRGDGSNDAVGAINADEETQNQE